MEFTSIIMMNLRWKPICENVIVVQLLCSSFCRFGFGGKCLNISGEVIRHNKNIFKIFLALSNFKKSSDTFSNGCVDFIGTNRPRSSQFGCFCWTIGHSFWYKCLCPYTFLPNKIVALQGLLPFQYLGVPFLV